MRSSGSATLFRRGAEPPRRATLCLHRRTAVFSTAQTATAPSSSATDDGASSRSAEDFFDVTLVGDYLVQMSTSPPTLGSADDEETFVWQLYPIKDVIAASAAAPGGPKNDSDEADFWRDGTEAKEALRFGSSRVSATALVDNSKPRAELWFAPTAIAGDSWDSKAHRYSDEIGNEMLSLLQILQAQWAIGQQQKQQQQQKTNNNNDAMPPVNTQGANSEETLERKISVDSLSSQEGITGLFKTAGLLGDGDDIASIEWSEMMTGSSKIVGRLPRPFVHKFNVLHRGIGAFVTRDRPITDVSSSSPSWKTRMPDLYVHRRASDKRIFPSLYDMFVGGVSLAGEDSELTAQREIAEELGLSEALTTPLLDASGGVPLLTCLVCTGYNRCLVDLFQYTVDASSETITWQEEEVAWGDFVDYGVIEASAAMSIQRLESPGEKETPLPSSPLESVAKYDGNWQEWDYVPDGLLVWKAWLELIETEGTKKNTNQQQQQPTFEFEINFGSGDGEDKIAYVELASMADIVPKSQRLASEYGVNINEMQTLLKNMWADATFIPVYDGKSVPIESNDRPECSIELPSGLVLEVRPSTKGEGAGLGLFMRKASSDTNDVLQTQGSIFCGYGPCGQITDSMAGLSKYQRERSFEFMLSDGLNSYVWHKGNLVAVRDVLQSTGATGVKAHLLVETTKEGGDANNPSPTSSGLSLIHDTKGKPCYLIPPAEKPDPGSLTIETIGHMCNDEAGGIPGQTSEEYDAMSDDTNTLVLVPRVEVNDDGIVEPSGMPLLTLSKSVYVGNADESMEVGLRYGFSYWNNDTVQS